MPNIKLNQAAQYYQRLPHQQSAWDWLESKLTPAQLAEFIERSLDLLKPKGRLLFLLPGDHFASYERCDRFENFNCHISHRWRIRGRVAYVKEGVSLVGRQISDSVYEIKPGKTGATETVL